MSDLLSSWRFWAVLSAGFAAATAILAKVGIDGVAPNVATFIRTVVILMLTGAIVAVAGQMPDLTRVSTRNLVFLILSGLAAGASWLCYFRALKLGEASRVTDERPVVIIIGAAAVGSLFLAAIIKSLLVFM